MSKIIQLKPAKKELSKSQKKFNSTIAAIEKLRIKKECIEGNIAYIKEINSSMIKPLIDKINEKKKEVVHDWAFRHDTYKLAKKEKKVLNRAICDYANELIEEGHEDMIEVFDKYSKDETYEELKESEAELQRQIFSATTSMFGLDVPKDLDITNEEQMARFFAEKKEEEREKANAKKKIDGHTAKELKDKEKTDALSRSLRDIYTELAKALHPDLELDEEARVRKEALMKQVTQAYQEKDLLKLLELQIEVNLVDQESLEKLTEDKLKQFIKVLTEKKQDLEYQIHVVSASVNPQNPFFDYLDKPSAAIDGFADKYQKSLKKDLKIYGNILSIDTVEEFKLFLMAKKYEQDELDAELDFPFPFF